MKRKISISDIAFIFIIILTIFMGVISLMFWDVMEKPFRFIFIAVFLAMGIIILNGIKLNADKNKFNR